MYELHLGKYQQNSVSLSAICIEMVTGVFNKGLQVHVTK